MLLGVAGSSLGEIKEEFHVLEGAHNAGRLGVKVEETKLQRSLRGG